MLMIPLIWLFCTIAHAQAEEFYERAKRLKFYKFVFPRSHQDEILSGSAAKARNFMLREYDQNVTEVIASLKNLTDEYRAIGSIRIELYHECYNAQGRTLSFIAQRLVKDCIDPISSSDAQDLANRREILMNFILRFNNMAINSTIPDPGKYLLEHLTMSQMLSADFENAGLFDRYYYDYDEAIRKLMKEVKTWESWSYWENRRGCILRSFFNTANFHYPTIKKFQMEIEEQLKDLAQSAETCSKVVDTRYLTDFEEMMDNLVIIRAHVAEWFQRSMPSAWPSTHNQILREQIMRNIPKRGFFDQETLQTVVNLIHPLLLNTGLPGYSYEILIIKAHDDKYEGLFEGLEEYCTSQKGVHGFDTVINRKVLNSTENDERIARLNTLSSALNIAIQQDVINLPSSSSLLMFSESLVMMQEFVSNEGSHCWSMIRRGPTLFWKACLEIEHFSSSSSGVTSEITVFNYTRKGWLSQSCRNFRWFLLS